MATFCLRAAWCHADYENGEWCKSGGRHLGKFAWGANLALVFEAVQSRPSITFPESWHDYWKQYSRSFGRGICLPDSPNWRYKQNYDVNKWQVWIREAFLGRISASPEATDSRSRRDVMQLSNKRSPYLFGVATANRTKVTTPNKYGGDIIARMSDWENGWHCWQNIPNL